MLSPLSRRVGRVIRSRELLAPGDRVAVALSGGPDSVALLLLLSELAAEAEWRLAGVIHVSHGLRPEVADADVAFCRDLSARLALPIDVTAVDTRRHMADERLSLETAARDLRYRAFDAAARRLDATVVATGHTADDQAETVLLRLLRGASLRGVSGIRSRRGIFARPLLDVRHADLLAYLATRRQPFREDESNRDEGIPRNRLRHRVMPAMEAFAPGGVRALSRFAQLAAEDEAHLEDEASRAWGDAVRIEPDGVEVERGQLVALPGPVARRVLRRALETAGGRPTHREVESVLSLARSSQQRSRVTLAGVWAERDGGLVRLGRPPVAIGSDHGFHHQLLVPGATRIPETGSVIRASLWTGEIEATVRRSAGLKVALQASRLDLPLAVRRRRPGDRLRPIGAPGTRKLQDLLVDRKVAFRERDLVPIVVDSRGQIVWVAGVAVAEHVRATTPQTGVVILEIEKDRR